MATTSEARALPFFTDLFGSPLESGFIYIGQAGLDPVAYPAIVTSDIAGSTVVAQPVRTTHGHAAAAGALIHLFCPIPYSITILDSAGRLVYASLNETDPVINAIGASSVQSAANLAALRARSGPSANQVWVNGFGLYVYDPSDTTSPENIPSLIVGNDGSRYDLSAQFVNAGWVKVASDTVPSSQGGWLSNNGTGTTFLTNNPGATTGGFRIRVVSPDGSTETGSLAISNLGAVSTTSDIRSAGNLVAEGGDVFLNAAASRAITYDPVGNQYTLQSSDLFLNGSLALTDARLPSVLPSNLVNINQNHLVGAILLNQVPAAPTPGTWLALVTGLGASGINQWLRVA